LQKRHFFLSLLSLLVEAVLPTAGSAPAAGPIEGALFLIVVLFLESAEGIRYGRRLVPDFLPSD
jgi:hypothetical protein